MNKPLCECSAQCDPKNYEGRTMLFPDEAWHNWYFSGRIKDRFDVTSQGDYYDRMNAVHEEIES